MHTDNCRLSLIGSLHRLSDSVISIGLRGSQRSPPREFGQRLADVPLTTVPYWAG